MDRLTYKLAELLKKDDRLEREMREHKAQLAARIREWSDSREGVRGGYATEQSVRKMLRDLRIL